MARERKMSLWEKFRWFWWDIFGRWKSARIMKSKGFPDKIDLKED